MSLEIQRRDDERSIFNPAPATKPFVPGPKSDTGAGPARPLTRMQDAINEFDAQAEAEERMVLEVLMKNAAVLLQAKESRLATNLLRSVLMRQPDHPGALRFMGDIHREEGRYEDALKCYRAFVKAGGGVEGQILVAETLYLGERDEMALGAYREVLKNVVQDRSKLFDVYKNVGNIHVRSGDFEAAEEYYDKAYNLNALSDILMVNYGTLEIQRNNLGDAVERFRQAVAINPNNDKGWVGLAIVHRNMGDLELAWANVQRALDINRANRTAIRLMVDWSVLDHSFAVVIERLQEYLGSEGEDAEMSFTLAKIFTHVGRLRDARLELERVLALDPAIEGGEALKKAIDAELAKKS